MNVGSTSNEFKVRFRKHKSAMSTKKTSCEIAVHFNIEKHQLSEFEFIVIEQICNIDDKHNVDKRLFTREAFWCSQLCTLQPMPLTKDRNLIPRIELSVIDTSHPLNCIFYYFLLIYLTVSFNKRIYCPVIADASFRGFCYSSIGFSIHGLLLCTLLLLAYSVPSRIMLC